MGQAVFIALGLALGVGLVVTVAAPRLGTRGQDDLNCPYGGISVSKVAEVARLKDVAAAAGGLSLIASWRVAMLRPADALARVV
jgi:hypothetical protein